MDIPLLKPIFTKDQVNLSNADLSDKLIEILYDKLIDLSGFRYDLYTHRLLTTAVLLAKEYDLDSVLETIKDDVKLRNVYNYLYEIYKINDQIDLSSDNFLQAIQYDNWHENSRYITDHLDEDMQPKEILMKLFDLYDWMKNSLSKWTDHDLFTVESTLFLEDYND